MAFAVIDNIRYGEDFANAADCIIGECPYKIFLTVSTNQAITLDSLDNSITTPSYSRIKIADGYRSYLVLGDGYSDGYLYPIIKEEMTANIVASSSVLTMKQVILGPICLPYAVFPQNPFYGGIDPNFFSPSSSNMQYWINIVGPGVLGGDYKGAYYDIKSTKLDLMSNLVYYLVLEATAENPPGT